MTTIGIVGAGRTRFGLGPVLARCAERAGLRVAGVAGRSPERAQANAEDLAKSLGHAVVAHPSVEAMCAAPIEALFVASPAEHHRRALAIAASRALPVLCEKPLVHEADLLAGASLVARFAAGGTPLMENCQWTHVVHALLALAPSAAPERVELCLAPPRAGREMIANSLSHLISVIQVVMPIDAATTVHDVRLEPAVLDGRATVLHFTVAGVRRVEAALHVALRREPTASPWIAFDGERLERRIDARFDAVFTGPRGSVTVPEPIQALVGAFAALVRARDAARTAAGIAVVRERLRLYRDILERLA